MSGRCLFFSFFHFFDTAWTSVLNIVPFRLGRNVNTENFSYLESEILGKKGDGRKNNNNNKNETMNLDLQQETQG